MWDELTLSDKARMIALAVRSGISDLRTIQEVYNTYAQGGDLLEEDNIYAKGGKIHIKPENRGKFTALKEKTGHSASWFKENGTPAQKKMATFALNARKWHHKDIGGPLGSPNILNSPHYNATHEAAMYNYLANELNDEQTAGIMGNLAVESYLNADMKQKGGGPAYGLIQAEGARQKAMKNYHDVPYLFGSGLSWEEQQQLDYMLNKGIKSYTPGEWGRKGFSGARQARQAFIDSNDTQEASDIFTFNYLRPGKPNVARRRAMSNYYYDKYKQPYVVPFNALFE